MLTAFMNITVIGPGAIGSLWASYLTEAGHSVNVWSRSFDEQIRIQRDDHDAIELANNNINQLNNADVILVTLKAPYVTQVLSTLVEHINSDTILLLMHNGMGTASDVQQMLPANPLLLATTTHGAYRPSSKQVLHTGQGKTLFGAVNESGLQCQFLVDVFNHALPTVDWHTNIEQALWNKLAINCAINPLTALYAIPNGHLGQSQYRAQLDSVIDEVCQVMQAEGIEVENSKLHASVHDVIRATSNNYSSMQQDIAHQRLSEIDFITGYVVAKAAQHRIDVPSNTKLYQAIKQIEQSW